MSDVTQKNTLTGVSETLLIPLAVRYDDNQDPQPYLPDPTAITIVERLQVDLSKFPPNSGAFFGIMARGNIIDDAVNQFIATHPDATIINLGAGLCTRFERLKTRPANWIDIDLPGVEPYWRAAFAPDTARRFIAASVTDPALWQQLGGEASSPIMVVAEGLMMYLAEADVRMILGEISQRFPGAEMLMEVISPFFAGQSANHPSLSNATARFDWGIRASSDLESWVSNLKILEEWRLMEWRPENNRPAPKLGIFLNMMMIFPLFKNGFRVVHLRLGPEE